MQNAFKWRPEEEALTCRGGSESSIAYSSKKRRGSTALVLQNDGGLRPELFSQLRREFSEWKQQRTEHPGSFATHLLPFAALPVPMGRDGCSCVVCGKVFFIPAALVSATSLSECRFEASLLEHWNAHRNASSSVASNGSSTLKSTGGGGDDTLDHTAGRKRRRCAAKSEAETVESSLVSIPLRRRLSLSSSWVVPPGLMSQTHHVSSGAASYQEELHQSAIASEVFRKSLLLPISSRAWPRCDNC